METQVLVEQLSIGMFVSALDRPWLDTPFLLQGFVIEDEATLGQLRQMCRRVTVDFSRSNLDEHDHLAIQGRPLTPGDQTPVMVRTVPAPSSLQRPVQTGSWLSRLLRSMSQSADSAEPEKSTEALESSAMTVRDTSLAWPPVVLGAVQARAQPDSQDEAGQSQGPRRSMPPRSADLFAWLRQSLSEIRFDQRSKPYLDEPGEPSSGNASAQRSPLELRVYADAVPIEQELGPASASFARATHVFEGVIRDIRLGKGLEIEAVENVVEDLVDSIIRNPSALQLVSRLREADESAYSHALQVAVLMVTFGRELGFSRAELTHLGQVGMLLDIGKLRVDRSILGKRSNLTPEEFEQVKRHVEYGLEIIAPSAVAHPEVIAGVAQHHERLNGSGYPAGLLENDIGAFGQMGGIVDAFAALTSVRPYAEPLSPYEAMRQLQGWGGTHFNAGLVEQFIQAIGIFPVGTLVELSSGEIAVVLEQNRARRLKPKLLLMSGPDKTPLKIPVTLDLLYGGGAAAAHAPYIRRGLAADSSGMDPTEFYLSRS